MKKFLCNVKTAAILMIVAAISLGLLTYIALRPISYGMDYSNKTEYDGGVFEGSMKFTSGGKMINSNTNLDEVIESRYYYKDGYVFFLMAMTDEEYEAEVAEIMEDFDAAKDAPFYADEINAFRMVASEGDGYETVYTCTLAITLVAALGSLALISAGLALVSILLKNKIVE